MNVVVVVSMLAGAVLIMWMGEVITQRGIGNGMSLIIFANIISGLPASIIQSLRTSDNGILLTILTVVVIVAVVPFIVYIERGQRRIAVQYAKRVVGRRIMGGQSTYLPVKVNTAGVIPIIFASAILYLPAQIAVFFPGVGWISTASRTPYLRLAQLDSLPCFSSSFSRTSTPPWCSTPMRRPTSCASRAASSLAFARAQPPRPTSRTF